MNRNVLSDPYRFNSNNSLQSIKTHTTKIDKCSNPTFHYDYRNKSSLHTPIIDFYHFTECADELLRSNSKNNSYAVIAFDINKFSEINAYYGASLANELINHIGFTLKNNIKEPSLYCNVNENFVILLENYKSIDIAMLVIQLSEEISSYYPEMNVKLTFGICNACQFDKKISSLYKRAFYAKSTIKGQEQQLLASYTELK